MSFEPGQLIPLNVTFTNAATGAVADPTTLTLTLAGPTGAQTVYTFGVGSVITKTSTGVYAASVDSTGFALGKWTYDWAGTGAVIADASGVFEVGDVAGNLYSGKTLADMVAEVRNHLYANQSSEANRLSGGISSSATSMALHYAPGTMTQRGAICSVDLEDIRIWETAGNTATVIERGINGSTPAAHLDSAYVEVMPKFSPWRIAQAINEDLDDLASPWNGIFAMVDLELTYNPAVSGYDMTGVTPGQVLDIQEVRFKVPGPSKYLPAIRKFTASRSVPIADYPSGMALLLQEGGYPGMPIHVRYRSRFNHFVNLTDDAQAVALLPPEANGLPALGAAITLMAGREVKRNFTEATTDPLQLELVLAGAVGNSYKGLMMLRQQRITAVAAGLLRQYGPPLRVL